MDGHGSPPSTSSPQKLGTTEERRHAMSQEEIDLSISQCIFSVEKEERERAEEERKEKKKEKESFSWRKKRRKRKKKRKEREKREKNIKKNKVALARKWP